MNQETRDAPTVIANDERWSVLLSADYTMQELAALMGGLRLARIAVEAFPLGEGVFALIPLLPNHPPPDAKFLMSCMAVGALQLPRLAIR